VFGFKQTIFPSSNSIGLMPQKHFTKILPGVAGLFPTGGQSIKEIW